MWQQIWKNCSLCYPSHCTITLKKILNSSTDDRSCVGLRTGCVPRFICWLLACRCAVEVCVTQAVSGSCDQKLSAQQLETTYITQLQCESKESYHAGQRGWHCRRKTEFNRISRINRASCKTIHQIQKKQQVQIKYLKLHVKIPPFPFAYDATTSILQWSHPLRMAKGPCYNWTPILLLMSTNSPCSQDFCAHSVQHNTVIKFYSFEVCQW